MLTYLYGDVTKVDYTPGSAVSAGDVIVSGDCCLVAHLDIASGDLGAVTLHGGVYTVPKATGEVWAIGDSVYYDESAENLTKTATDNVLFGRAAAAAISGATSSSALLLQA